jgi:hypothetical protein
LLAVWYNNKGGNGKYQKPTNKNHTNGNRKVTKCNQKLQNCNLQIRFKYGIINTVKERKQKPLQAAKITNQQNTQKSQGKFGENAD